MFDGITGGYNLQEAFSTGYLGENRAGKNNYKLNELPVGAFIIPSLIKRG